METNRSSTLTASILNGSFGLSLIALAMLIGFYIAGGNSVDGLCDILRKSDFSEQDYKDLDPAQQVLLSVECKWDGPSDG